MQIAMLFKKYHVVAAAAAVVGGDVAVERFQSFVEKTVMIVGVVAYKRFAVVVVAPLAVAAGW